MGVNSQVASFAALIALTSFWLIEVNSCDAPRAQRAASSIWLTLVVGKHSYPLEDINQMTLNRR